MKGDAKVIGHLNKLLTHELTAMDQYFLHSRLYEDMGLYKLYERIDHEMTEEQEHADALLKRIIFLEGTPEVGKRDPLKIGTTVPEMLNNDLQVEYTVAADLKAAIACCEEAQDYVTREILEKLLFDTEEAHAYWLEQQLGLIKLTGLENYLQSQMGEAGPEE